MDDQKLTYALEQRLRLIEFLVAQYGQLVAMAVHIGPEGTTHA